jgi:hypothetical protein
LKIFGASLVSSLRMRYYQAVVIELPDKLQAEVDAEVESLVKMRFGTFYEPRIKRTQQEVADKQRELADKQRELETLKSEYSQAIGRYVERLRGGASNRSPQTSTSDQGVSSRLRDLATQDGSRKLPSRRKMLLAVLPNFMDKAFIRRDVEHEVLEKWPEAKPKTDAEHNNFTSGIAKALKEMVNKGQLTATKGRTPFEPTIYRLTDKGKEMLLRSGP